MANQKIKYRIQKFFGRWFDRPVIPLGKTTGYSLVRSEQSHCTLGRHTQLDAPYILHHVAMGDYSYLSRNALVANTTIGKFCSIGPNLCCGQGLHPTTGISTHPMFYSPAMQNGVTLSPKSQFTETKHTTIGNAGYIGANVFILDGVVIGDGAVVGAGAVVTRDVPPYAVAVGVPARVVKYRFDPETIQKLLRRQWWNDPDSKLPQVAKQFWNVDDFLSNN